MAKEFELDLTQFIADLNASAETIAKGAERGMHDALDDWKRQSVDIAPIKSSTLRRSITTELNVNGLDMDGVVTANATEKSGRGTFNYAYYIHEGDGKAVTGEKKFLDKPAEQSVDKWMRWIEEEIKDELAGRGW